MLDISFSAHVMVDLEYFILWPFWSFFLIVISAFLSKFQGFSKYPQPNDLVQRAVSTVTEQNNCDTPAPPTRRDSLRCPGNHLSIKREQYNSSVLIWNKSDDDGKILYCKEDLNTCGHRTRCNFNGGWVDNKYQKKVKTAESEVC